MRQSKLSIKWKIFLYLMLFTGALLCILWLFQICYLDKFYKAIKTKEAEQASEKLMEIIGEEEDVEEEIDQLAAAYNLAILVTDQEGNRLYGAEYLGTGGMKNMPQEEFKRLLEEARKNDGFTKIEYVGGNNHGIGKELPTGEPMPQQTPGETFIQNRGMDFGESVIYVRLVEENDREMVVMLNTLLTPVTSTVETLKIQLMYITAILIVLAIAVAFLLSKKVSKSIVTMNTAAKRLAAGDFDVTFEGKDYKEAAELSQTLNYAAKELGKTEKYRQELLANVSHDLRTPLTMIIAYAEVMRDLPGENTPENIQVVIDESKRLSNLVNDMLDISKLQSKVVALECCEYNLTESIYKVLERYNKLKEQEGYTIEFEYAEEVFVNADEEKIFQVLYNLINNAIHYTGENKLVTVRQVVKKDVVRIEVIDTGKGIPQEELNNVWERYYKVDKEHRRAVSGTGLGLSIVKNILELHQAAYGVDSLEGAGSTFWFELHCLEQ